MSKRRFNYINTLDFESVKRKSAGRASRYTKGAVSKSLVGKTEAKKLTNSRKRQVSNMTARNVRNRIKDIAISPLSKTVRKSSLVQNNRRRFDTGGPVLEDFVPPIGETRSNGKPTAPGPWVKAIEYISRGQRNGVEWDWLPTPVPCLWPQTDAVTGYPLEASDETIEGTEFSSIDYYVYNECVHYLADLDGDGIITMNDVRQMLCNEEGIMCPPDDGCDEEVRDTACEDDGFECGWSVTCTNTWCGSCGDQSSCIAGQCEPTCDYDNPTPLGQIGDVNEDGYINILDVVRLTNYILGMTEFTPCQVAASDWNGDGIINVVDVVAMVNHLLGNDIDIPDAVPPSNPGLGAPWPAFKKNPTPHSVYRHDLMGNIHDYNQVGETGQTEQWRQIIKALQGALQTLTSCPELQGDVSWNINQTDICLEELQLALDNNLNPGMAPGSIQ